MVNDPTCSFAGLQLHCMFEKTGHLAKKGQPLMTKPYTKCLKFQEHFMVRDISIFLAAKKGLRDRQDEEGDQNLTLCFCHFNIWHFCGLKRLGKSFKN